MGIPRGVPLPGVIAIVAGQQRGRSRESPPAVLGRQTLQHGVAHGPPRVDNATAQLCIGVIRRERKAQEPQRRIEQRGGDVVLLLAVDVLLQPSGILRPFVTVVRLAMIPLGIHLPRQTAGPFCPVVHLSENVAETLALVIHRIVVDHLPRQLLVAVIVVELALETGGRGRTVVHIDLSHAVADGVVRAFLPRDEGMVHQRERVAVVRPQEVALQPQAPVAAQPLFPLDAGIHIAERTGRKPRLQPVVPSGKHRRIRAQIERGRRSQGTGRDKDVGIVAHHERQTVHLLQRETAQVYLPALAVGHGQSVVDHPRMGGTHGAHRQRLHATHATIIADVRTGHAAQGVRQVRYALTVQVSCRQRLRGHRAVVPPPAVGLHLHRPQFFRIMAQRIEHHLTGPCRKQRKHKEKTKHKPHPFRELSSTSSYQKLCHLFKEISLSYNSIHIRHPIPRGFQHT